MTRPVVLTLAAALGGVLLFAGCNRDAPTTAPPPAPTAPEPPPAPTPPAPATVTSVELGNAVDDQNRVSTPASEFATTDTIYASVGTEGESAAKLAARWTFGEGQLVRNTEADVAAGPQVIAFDIHHPEGWPVGTYKLEISLDGTVVETREFSVK
ncbi:hypothetical protein LU699_09090 [Luteimonas fraxinea]|uniref:PKD domain-containing protein n=1 Tax=Luteimonas fraxinea TaxID=2901869 RepID=A0ABS8UDN9_9GAMM|nr:hypothetical protein [Luteimonas fraxinea]MCD9097588.1 hypothetical protein [Luteimonas fraxinea]MCD9124861.1 hypothetical protein [Luteimonas fraxinea]UHH08487.1 hypothetical protein LU699_09090 [Luteimonas fraxinea]